MATHLTQEDLSTLERLGLSPLYAMMPGRARGFYVTDDRGVVIAVVEKDGPDKWREASHSKLMSERFTSIEHALVAIKMEGL